jgi:sensor histidine kinase YesM
MIMRKKLKVSKGPVQFQQLALEQKLTELRVVQDRIERHMITIMNIITAMVDEDDKMVKEWTRRLNKMVEQNKKETPSYIG